MSRPLIEETMMKVAVDWSERATCPRRAVGCVLANERNHMLSSGYNGPAKDMPHCTDVPCEGQHIIETGKHRSGDHLVQCEAIHAEANALLQCPDVYKIDTAYCTTAPCVECIKLLMNTGCRRIVFLEGHVQADRAEALWSEYRNRIWVSLSDLIAFKRGQQ